MNSAICCAWREPETLVLSGRLDRQQPSIVKGHTKGETDVRARRLRRHKSRDSEQRKRVATYYDQHFFPAQIPRESCLRISSRTLDITPRKFIEFPHACRVFLVERRRFL